MKKWDLDERQKKTLAYFNENAGDWRRRAEADGVKRVSTIRQRNDHAIRLIDKSKFKTGLDLGCGSGELVFEFAKRGLDCMGVDFSQDMIDLCNEKAKRLGFNEQCQFQVGSVVDVDYGDRTFDLVTAFGFIEYLRPEQLEKFFEMTRSLVNDGGRFQVGSRNRLFNIMSLNKFTEAELGANTIHELVAEAVSLSSADSLDDYLIRVESDIGDKQVLKKYPQTDVDVAGYQYTPAELCRLLTQSGFTVEMISPVHYHGFIPAVARENSEMHANVSNLVHDRFHGDHRMVPYSSTYMITAY